eukprot:TRINITY_DN38087_c0_g1_i1.p1 TRINITY_DN38087_c0_g1~~TRINITY_DN38087_c0_g1_i1.p1  ORF type:complete len:194 (+),score=41.95 TRINITY_DN38087_c0_g1_i1:128-709(+)
MEWGESEKQRHAGEEEHRGELEAEPGFKLPFGCKVVLDTATNPLVIGSVVGVVINFSCGRTCLNGGVAGNTLTTIGHVYTFSALFLTGLSIGTVNSDQEGEGRGNKLRIGSLVIAKNLVLPILIRLTMSGLLSKSKEHYSTFLNFGYLYGTLPVAPLPVVLAYKYKLQPAVIALAAVVSTFLSMPLLLSLIHI